LLTVLPLNYFMLCIHTFLGIVAEVLGIDSGLLGQHLEVVAYLLLACPPVNLLLQAEGGERKGGFLADHRISINSQILKKKKTQQEQF
jgi:hypothetical protein